ncbi:hypothetical protein Patl1_20504 [Pistacia atlantica]|uniref:Uncharacterized protein n=1 Tax=Pistacia atlantica TaxID=434234 RepID=A0ACC1BK70_9ROSI|nr:hypothetical protein Patl1_20504 [Pistacia atlantica]
MSLSDEVLERAHCYALFNTTVTEPFLQMHLEELKQSNNNLERNHNLLQKTHANNFATWFKEKVSFLTSICEDGETLKWLANSPRNHAMSYNGYVINGQRFHTKDVDKSTQNSGVSIEATTICRASAKDTSQVVDVVAYYGVIKEIILLDYYQFQLPIFKCHWANAGHGVKFEDGFTLVNLHQSQNQYAPPRGYYELEMYNEDQDLTSRPEYVTTRYMNIYDDSEEVSYVIEDCEGQPIDEESIKLSSFLGPLGKEIIPFTIPDWRKLPSDMREKLWKCVQARYKLDQEWQKHYVLKEMSALWRTSKSRLVSNIKMAKNEEERMALKPNNIKSISEWKKFVEEKLGPKFKGKSEEMKNRRKKQTSYTGGRRGHAHMTEDIKKKTGKRVVSRVEVWIEAHKKKNGEPINTKTAEAIEKLQQMGNDSSLPTPTNLKEGATTKILGPDTGGHVKGLGKGVTLTQLSIIAQRDNLIAQMAQQQGGMKMEMNHMKDLLNLALNQNHASITKTFSLIS